MPAPSCSGASCSGHASRPLCEGLSAFVSCSSSVAACASAMVVLKGASKSRKACECCRGRGGPFSLHRATGFGGDELTTADDIETDGRGNEVLSEPQTPAAGAVAGSPVTSTDDELAVAASRQRPAGGRRDGQARPPPTSLTLTLAQVTTALLVVAGALCIAIRGRAARR